MRCGVTAPLRSRGRAVVSHGGRRAAQWWHARRWRDASGATAGGGVRGGTGAHDWAVARQAYRAAPGGASGAAAAGAHGGAHGAAHGGASDAAAVGGHGALRPATVYLPIFFCVV